VILAPLVFPVEMILFVLRRTRKPRQVGVAISWDDINDDLATKLCPMFVERYVSSSALFISMFVGT
jgi:hypothetical protein